MQIGKDTPVRLMIIDDSGEAAEGVVSTFRNDGIAVRPLRPLDAEELVQQLASQPVDLILVAKTARTLPVSTVLEQVAAVGKDIPVVVMVDASGTPSVVDDLINGASAVAVRSRPDHLLSVLRAEWEDLEARRGLRRLEAQLRETERRCDALIASSRDPIAYVHEGMHIRANDAYLDMFGFASFEDIEGLSLLDLIAPKDVEDFKQLLKRIGKGEPPPPRYECEARTLDGEAFPAVMEFATATYEGEACVQVVFRRRELDTELAREVEDLRQRDVVTGLLNRPTFLHALEDAVAQVGQGEQQYGLLLVEPDHYARLLPDIGLGSADALIAAMAARFSSLIGEGMVAARFSEHGFAVLCHCSHADTAALAERLRAGFAAHVFEIGSHAVTATLSVGGVQIGEKIASVSQVLARASENLQSVASVGGNGVLIFDPAAVDRAEAEYAQRILDLVREALTGSGFALHYQPIIPLLGAPGDFYEGFLRLDNGSGERIKPVTFLAIAEEAGLLADIDRWVVRAAIAALAARERAGRPTRMVVKISQASFGDTRLVETIAHELAATGLPGERLWLETTEAKVFTHLRAAQELLQSAARLGCKVGLEQFGTGLDSFQLLAHFTPAFLKLDRSFTQDHTRVAENQDKIREITARAQRDGITTIAEHVQDPGTMSLLFGAGLDYVEGSFVANAMPEMSFDFNA
ncbi:GGDEF/EAL domain-containing response regulator [Pseudoxanthomonas winnipegensis]|uniref:EAL domain-containing protein n=1 Tax=Pseudoxanthomonas winnipegensis TaxID=2480810 RepID=A0A4V2HFI2_9GAMM|nr:EAL domain-containing protein [Pseudoxanthomonas winnipegensis]RZZ87060.1 EAL domain-containing protein [Pseudoxanthomonas winnipegensis]TAA37731.1 EAL domain-containing protein [Pseudoxanthomonas winnipegensis]